MRTIKLPVYLCIVLLYSPVLHCSFSSLNLTVKLNVIHLVIICIITWIYNKLCSGCEKWSQLSKVCSTYIKYNDQQGETTVQINVLSCNLCSHSLQINLSSYISFSLKFEDKITEIQQQETDEQQREEAEQQGEVLKQELEMGFT